MTKNHAMTEALLEQLEWIQEALPEGDDVGDWVRDGADFGDFGDFATDEQCESVSHAVGYIQGVADALDMTIVELLDGRCLLDPRERATQQKLTDARAAQRVKREVARAVAANVKTAPMNKQGVRDLSGIKRAGGAR